MNEKDTKAERLVSSPCMPVKILSPFTPLTKKFRQNAF
jgi:hypothetical protein